MEKLAEAGAAPFGWRMELQDVHQLSQALTLHSLSRCCSFSPFCASPLSKGTDQKTAKVTVSCQGAQAACPGAPAGKR